MFSSIFSIHTIVDSKVLTKNLHDAVSDHIHPFEWAICLNHHKFLIYEKFTQCQYCD